ncbi:TetR/AcrR family transcriptional regulator [Nonomuraea aurantiaca]|uniref:TetR/AcrR family transcriptional regulator n=1 Tax=Nonomuraea aurantiaca TaxID=2878562 RepID=UPI001CD9424A|nr:TetR/AcrR family transcriptional regulator [Nonomuraea aurantiaca]MCA2224984.1 TetR/AcrR family transcriptional regulator [Nonomuraea aurantiaca]
MVNETRTARQQLVNPLAGPRERYRQQIRAEVQEHAWKQLAEAGASGLSLKAIAKQMGITAPALYRYFASRDDLLTELILSAYRDLAHRVEATTVTGGTPRDRLTAIGTVIREWARDNRHRYLLLYGTPVPGYTAPAEATDLARRIFAPVQDAFSHDPDETLHRSLTFWTRVHGVISLEVAGHFTGMPFDPAQLFASEVLSTLTDLP